MDGNNSNGNGLEKSSLSLYTQLSETVHKSAGIETDVWRSKQFQSLGGEAHVGKR